MKKLTLLGVTALLCLLLAAQENTAIKPLTVGDTVPDISFTNLINYPSKTARLSDFKNKLVILDFWATYCVSCIKNFPKLYKLQQEFPSDINVLLVNSKSAGESYEKVKNFLNTRSTAYRFPSIMADTVLEQLFPHEAISHSVWIKNNKVVAITDAENVTGKTIAAVLEGKPFQEVKQAAIEYNFVVPLFENNNGGTAPGYLYKSFLTPYKEGLKSTMYTVRDEQGRTSRITFTNSTLLNLYGYAYSQLGNASPVTTLFKVAHTTVFTNKTDTANFFCYEAIFPARPVEDAIALMQADLNKYFGYKVETSVQERDCWVITVSDTGLIKRIDPSATSETNLFENSGLPIYIKNYPVKVLTDYLERLYKMPVLDETKLNRAVSLSLPADLQNTNAVVRTLARQGLILKKENRKIPIIIITDK